MLSHQYRHRTSLRPCELRNGHRTRKVHPRLTYALMRHRGLRTDDAKLVRLLQQRTGACLGHWRRRGYLKSAPGAGDMLNWKIAEQP